MNSFDPRLANEVKVSFRDGKFYVFDGAHTLSALKRIHGEDSFMVDCKVYYGLSYEDEAYLFALQSGESRDVAFNTRLRALMLSGSREATDFRTYTAQAGFQLADNTGSATKNTIAAIAKAYRLYKEYGPEQYVQILQLIADTWNGAAWSVTGYLLGGVAVFLREYGEESTAAAVLSNACAARPMKPFGTKRAGSSAVPRMWRTPWRLRSCTT